MQDFTNLRTTTHPSKQLSQDLYQTNREIMNKNVTKINSRWFRTVSKLMETPTPLDFSHRGSQTHFNQNHRHSANQPCHGRKDTITSFSRHLCNKNRSAHLQLGTHLEASQLTAKPLGPTHQHLFLSKDVPSSTLKLPKSSASLGPLSPETSFSLSVVIVEFTEESFAQLRRAPKFRDPHPWA